MLFGMRSLTRNWQVGDGREEALAAHVLAHARAGDLDDAIRVIDDFCVTRSVMINVGDEKGEILDQAIKRAAPSLLLELGTYCGYSGLRMARVMPADARLCSIEFNPANAEIARRIWAHAGVGDRLTVIVGTLGDGGATIDRLRSEFGFTDGALDFVFLDHDKNAYLPDLERIVAGALAASGVGRRRRQRQVPGCAGVSGPPPGGGGQDLANDRARHARRVPVAAQGSGARVGVPGRGRLRHRPRAPRGRLGGKRPSIGCLDERSGLKECGLDADLLS